MSALLKIVDESFGGQAPVRRPALELRLVSERITPRDVIRERVKAEVETLNARRAQARHDHDRTRSWLVDIGPTEEQLNPKARPRPSRHLDAAMEIERAHHAFLKRSFIMLFDDRQIDDLDEAVTVGPHSEAVFLYMTPLKGG